MGCCWSDKKSFEGEGRRLGTGNNNQENNTARDNQEYRDDPLPQPVYNPNLSDEARDKMRADRAAAAEARVNKMGTTGNKKKNKKTNMPLRGPNTEPTMRWTA